MSSKFGHEKSNRQSKVWREPTQASGGYGDDAFHKRYRIDLRGVHLRKSVILHEGKVELLDDVHGFMRWLRFDLGGYSVSTNDTYPEFCERNGLNRATSQETFSRLSADLKRRIQMVMRRAARRIQCRQKNGAGGKPEFCLTVDIPAIVEGLLTVNDSRVEQDD